MRVDVPVKEITVSQVQFADAVGVTRGRVNQLANTGIVIRNDDSDNGEVLLFESLKNFFSPQNNRRTSMPPIETIAVTQVALARALQLSQARINQLIEEEIVVRDETSKSGRVMLFDSLRNFFMHKTGKSSSDDKPSYWDEKRLHEKAKRELAELKLAKAKGEVVNAADVEKTLLSVVTNLRTRLLALPSILAPQLEGKERVAISEILSSAIEDVLTDLSTSIQGSADE